MTPEPGFVPLFDGTEESLGRWRHAGPGGFILQDGVLVAQPGEGHGVLFYEAEPFDDFVLRLQFRLPGPVDDFGKAIGNSGVFLRFRYPRSDWSDVNEQEPRAATNPAWVAAATGFEVQIDEQGRTHYFEKHRTGAIYDVPTGEVIDDQAEPADQHYTPGPVLEPNRWYEFEIEVVGDTYAVGLGEAHVGEPTTYQRVTTFTKPAGKYEGRGLPASAGRSSGYIGVQCHSGNVAFRDIRVRTV